MKRLHTVTKPLGSPYIRKWLQKVWPSPCAVHLKLHLLLHWLYPNTKCFWCLKKKKKEKETLFCAPEIWWWLCSVT